MVDTVSGKLRPVLVVDFGAQYAQLIARRVREAQVYSEVVPSTMPVAEMLARNPVAIILSGGPHSVYDDDAPLVDASLFSAGVPVLGICYGFQVMAQVLGGEVTRTENREFGRTDVELNSAGQSSALLGATPPEQHVWMSHGDIVSKEPDGFAVTATSNFSPIAAFDNGAQICGVQWHPEVRHTEYGQKVLEEFLFNVAHAQRNWTTDNYLAEQLDAIRAQVGDARAICGLSGGVDSAVAAALVQRAIGDRLTCVYIDTGLMRAGETEQIERDFVAATGVNLVVRHEADRFLSALAGVSEPEAKRKIIGREFIRAFEDAEREIVAAHPGTPVKFLVQGTLYPDLVESGGGTGTANIKSHHNVGGLPDDMQFDLIEPLRLLFKDEVRELGRAVGVPEQIVSRQPFPGPGLGIRIIGAVTSEYLDVLRRADLIARTELTAAGLDAEIWQCPVVLLADVRSVGVQGDNRTYGHPIVLRPVTSEDAMTADWARIPSEVLNRISARITNEVPEVNRVVLDITSKPPGTIEWE